jgi:hypothetical protein
MRDSDRRPALSPNDSIACGGFPRSFNYAFVVVEPAVRVVPRLPGGGVALRADVPARPEIGDGLAAIAEPPRARSAQPRVVRRVVRRSGRWAPPLSDSPLTSAQAEPGKREHGGGNLLNVSLRLVARPAGTPFPIAVMPCGRASVRRGCRDSELRRPAVSQKKP